MAFLAAVAFHMSRTRLAKTAAMLALRDRTTLLVDVLKLAVYLVHGSRVSENAQALAATSHGDSRSLKPTMMLAIGDTMTSHLWPVSVCYYETGELQAQGKTYTCIARPLLAVDQHDCGGEMEIGLRRSRRAVRSATHSLVAL